MVNVDIKIVVHPYQIQTYSERFYKGVLVSAYPKIVNATIDLVMN